MNFTREDAKRLINDLPNHYVVTNRLNKSVTILRKKEIYNLEIKDVVLGMVEVNKKLTPVFIDPKDKRLKITLLSLEETKSSIEYWYIFVEVHQKATALLSIYNDVNSILEEHKKVDVQKSVEKVKELNKVFSDLYTTFEPLIVDHLPKAAYPRMKAKVEEVTKNRYSLGFDDCDDVGMEVYIIPKAPKASYIFDTVYQEDVGKMLEIISLSVTYRRYFTRIIYYNTQQSTVDFIKTVTPETANIFIQALELSIEMVANIRKTYEKDIKKCNSIILSISKTYEEPEFY